MQGDNNNAFNRAMRAAPLDSESPQSYIERGRNNDISKDEESLAMLSAKQLTNNVGRIFWTKTPTIQMRTTKRFKTPDSGVSRTPQMNQVKLVKQAQSPEPEGTTTPAENKMVVEKLEKVTKDLELNPKEKNVANPKVLEAWVNETLLEVERVEHSDQNIPWERKQPLRRFGLDRQSLEGSGMSKERIDRLYRCLFVYSAGFYEFINEMFEHSPNKFNLVGSVWKVFWILLEYCYKSEHQTILDEINKENKEHIERLFKELQKKDKELKDLEAWKEINFANVQKDLEQMRLDKENLLKEKMHLEEDVKINEKAYSDEVQLRIKFENKINDFYANYHDLKVKNTRILDELVVQNRKSEDLAKENQDFRVKNARANEKIIELEGTLKVTLEKLASREAAIDELIHDKEVIEKKLIDSFKANQAVDLGKLQSSFQNANFKLETSSTLNEMYQKNLVELEKLIATKNKDIAYLEERYKTLETAHEEKCKEALETEKERIKYFDLSNLLQEKLDITTKNLDQRNAEYDELLKDYSSLKHLLNAEREKIEVLSEERNAGEENIITLNRVRAQKEEEIAKLEKTLAEEYERMVEMQSNLDDFAREKERLEAVTQEQKQVINDYEEKMKENEVMMTNIKSDMFSNEDHMSKLMNKEKTNQQNIMNKLEEEQEKTKMFQLEIIQLKQTIETGVQERHKCNLKIQDLETQLQAVINAKDEIQATINGYATKKDEIEAERINEQHAWNLSQIDYEKRINELSKTIEELTAPKEKTYHPLLVEDLLSRIYRLDLKVTEFESRHYDDLRKLTEANGKIKQAKRLHNQLYALSQKLLKENTKLQEDMENKAFEAQRLKALTDFLQQRQEILTMQILDQREQLKEVPPPKSIEQSTIEKPLKGNLGPSLLKKENKSPKKRVDPPTTDSNKVSITHQDSPREPKDNAPVEPLIRTEIKPSDPLKESISQKDSRLNTSESIDRKSLGPNSILQIKPSSRANLNPSPTSAAQSMTEQIEKIEKKAPSRGLTGESKRTNKSLENKNESERVITKSSESKKSGLTSDSRAALEFMAGIDYVKRELLNSQQSERSTVSRRNFERADTENNRSKDASLEERKSREESKEPEVRKVGNILKERQTSPSIKSPLAETRLEKPKTPQEKPKTPREKPKTPQEKPKTPQGKPAKQQEAKITIGTPQDERSPDQRRTSPSPPFRTEEREQTPESTKTAGSRHHIRNIPSVEEEKNVSSSSSSSDSSSSSSERGSQERSVSSKRAKSSSKRRPQVKPGSGNKTRGVTGSKEFLTVGDKSAKTPIQQRVSFREESPSSDGAIFVEEQQQNQDKATLQSQDRSHLSRPISVNTEKIQPILMAPENTDEFLKTGESLGKVDRLQATGDFPTIGRAEKTYEDTSPGNITLEEVDAFYEQQLSVDQIIQIATQQTFNTNRQQSPSYLSHSPSGKPRIEDTFNATFNSLRSHLRPAFTGDNLGGMSNPNDLLPDGSTIRDGERPSTKSAFDQSFYNSSLKGTIDKSSKSALAPLQKGRPSSQPFENDKTQNKLKEILQGRPGTTQTVTSPLGALQGRARIPTISSQQSHDDGEGSQRVDSQGQPRSITALPPLKQIPAKQLQRGETGNSGTFSSSSKKSIERKRQYSIKEGGLQRLESKKSNISQESSPASSVNMSFNTKNVQRAPTRDLNKTYDVALEASIDASRSGSIPDQERYPSGRRASGIQVISELDSQRSSLPSTTPVQKAHRAGSLKMPERREKSMKTIEDDDAREQQTEEDDKNRRKQKSVSYRKSKTSNPTTGQEEAADDEGHDTYEVNQVQDSSPLDSEMRALIDALANRVQIEAKEEKMKPQIDLRSLVNKVKGSLTAPKTRSPGNDRSSKRGSPSYKNK